jgi:Domain of unknown function (DUF4145)
LTQTPEGLTRIGFCPHCCNRAPQKAIAVHTCSEITWFEEPDGGAEEEADYPGTYFVATCGTCQQLLIYWKQGDPADDGASGPRRYFWDAGLIWPDSMISEGAVPANVVAIYREAALVKRLSPNSFAVQIRRALEAVCSDKAAAGRSLYEMLAALATRGDLPPVLVEMTDVLRLLGNVGAHASDRTVRPSQVDALDEFFRAVIEYVYIAPAKLNQFRQTLRNFDRGGQADEA